MLAIGREGDGGAAKSDMEERLNKEWLAPGVEEGEIAVLAVVGDRGWENAVQDTVMTPPQVL